MPRRDKKINKKCLTDILRSHLLQRRVSYEILIFLSMRNRTLKSTTKFFKLVFIFITHNGTFEEQLKLGTFNNEVYFNKKVRRMDNCYDYFSKLLLRLALF